MPKRYYSAVISYGIPLMPIFIIPEYFVTFVPFVTLIGTIILIFIELKVQNHIIIELFANAIIVITMLSLSLHNSILRFKIRG